MAAASQAKPHVGMRPTAATRIGITLDHRTLGALNSNKLSAKEGIRADDWTQWVKPQDRRRGSDRVAQQIQDAVRSGALAVGDRLPNERELGRVFGVSRATIREAVRRLETEGMVEVRRGVTGGTFVVKPNADRLGLALLALIRFGEASAQHFTEFRTEFEPETAWWAAKQADAAARDLLLDLAADVAARADVAEMSWPEFAEGDIRFHEAVAEASKNPIRVAVMLAVHGAFRQSSDAVMRQDSARWRQAQARQLEAVAQAIAAGEADRAREAMRHHVRVNAAAVRAILAGEGRAAR
jgi:GntR family transcriptional repressor for pyruvate dehydrogenase complex